MTQHGSPLALVLACALAGCAGGSGGDAPTAFADAPAGPGNAADARVSDADLPAGAAPEAARRDPGPEDAGRAVVALERLGAHALVGLAGKLETGAPLDAAERDCLSAYDPALGEPLAALACAEPLPIAGTPVSLGAMRMRADAPCLAVLGDASRSAADVVAGCDWEGATLALATEWVAPPATASGGFEGRPRPIVGARFEYADAPPTLRVGHLPARLDGEFGCEADVASGKMSGPARCAADLAGHAARLEAFADALEPPVPN